MLEDFIELCVEISTAVDEDLVNLKTTLGKPFNGLNAIFPRVFMQIEVRKMTGVL